ncbi:tRNA (adenine-N1)-methyltransferase [Curtobacterium sp. MCPF17_031]|uniref:tRNA (adenine-N1)-methyltransferase n=1 Tax=Curtobacterium sp. MCPF17_031 TaxID=2175653 RepID=UPI000DA85DB9|nr:tRNA (adenine-N1)-methyltransferase [Curtobacterium sp. MCPF17_031]PZE39493.1 tRNA (adenine-N1)-methyltransferase [Curtobacterium sp. MCPF17_031]
MSDDTTVHDAAAAPEVELPHTAGGAPHTPPRGPFRAGDRVQLTGPKGKLTTLSLEPGVVYHTHRGMLAHDDVIGQPDGSVIRASTGDEYLALRPLLNDYVMSMPRGAAIVYPKDAAQIVAFADVFPGARVVEAGVGSGALSLWLLRAIGPSGSLQSFERREEFAAIARGNVGTFLGAVPDNWSVTVGDLVEELPRAVEPQSIDRVVLDMLAPWECVDEAADALAPGGLIVCYVATVTQLSRTAEALRDTGRFTDPQSSETLVRTWHVEGLAVRPDHRMVAHTGFLITARRLADGVVLPNLKRRAGKAEFSDEDVEAWTPGAVGERAASDKKLRKVARQAAAQARKVAAAEAASEAAVAAASEATAAVVGASGPSDGDR